MSIIKLETYVAARTTGGRLACSYGVGEALPIDGSGRLPIIFGSVALPVGMHLPSSVMVMLYGFRDAVEEIDRQGKILAPTHADCFQTIGVNFEVGDIFQGIMTAEDLPHARFANVKRMSSNLQHHIRDRFEHYLVRDGLSIDGIGRLKQIGRYPHLFDRLLREKAFKHLEVLVIPVEDESGRMRQFALVTRNAKPIAIEQNGGNLIVGVPPKGFMPG